MSTPVPGLDRSGVEPSPGEISVCIAAHNEEATIGRLLQQLTTAADGAVSEILVCANGCTDRTEELVARYVRHDPRVRLLQSHKGKPAAWNMLMRSARNDVRLFLDADVEPAPGFFAALRDALESNPRVAIIAARDLPRRRQAGADARLAATASRAFGFDYLCGRAYALRLGGLQVALSSLGVAAANGCPQLPLDVLHEDLWLEIAAGRSRIAFAPAARVFYDPGTLLDLLKTRARLQVARQQVASMMPNAFARWRIEAGMSRPLPARLRHRLGTMGGPGDAMACAVGAMARLLVTTLCRRTIRRHEARMIEQMARHGGHAVLAGSGRLSKGGRD